MGWLLGGVILSSLLEIERKACKQRVDNKLKISSHA